jgi:hypothetical protein
MSETLSLVFAFAWLFAVPPVHSDSRPAVAGDTEMTVKSVDGARNNGLDWLIGPLERRNRQI